MANLINGTSTGAGGLITTGDSSDELQLQTAETTAITINSSQNVGIGTSTPGARIEATASGAAVQILNRTTSDGNILDLEKDGTTVGSVGADTGDLIIHGTAAGHAGIRFAAAALLPTDNSGALTPNANDIGSGTNTWKDLYLSGSVYLGGTGAANALDDYEEGTWTPVFSSASFAATGITVASATYTKVGRAVLVSYNINITGTSGNFALNDVLVVTGMPFTSLSSSAAIFNASTSFATGIRVSCIALLGVSSTTINHAVDYVSGSVPRSSGLLCTICYQAT